MPYIPYCIKKTAKKALDFGNYLVFSCFPKKQFQKEKINKILLLNLQGVGDIVMTTPFLTAVRNAYPSTQIDYFCAKENGLILSSDNRVNRILSRKKDDFLSADFIQTLQQIRSQHYDLAINLFPAQHSALLTIFSGAPFLAGPLYSLSSVCSWSSQKMKPTWDVRLQCQHIASLLEISIPSPFSLSLSVSSSHKQNVFTKLRKWNRLHSHEKYIVLNIPAQWKAKQWPLEHWQQLVRCILAEKKMGKYDLAFLGTASDSEYVNEILAPFRENKYLENCCGKWTLEELPVVLQYASLVITTDSGPMHIASAVGTKTIGLFGVSDPALLAIGNPFITVVSAYDSCLKKYHFNHHSEPCDLDQECMKKIPVEEVFEKVKELL